MLLIIVCDMCYWYVFLGVIFTAVLHFWCLCTLFPVGFLVLAMLDFVGADGWSCVDFSY